MTKESINRFYKPGVTPMLILGDYQKVIKRLCSTNEKMNDLTLSDFSVTKEDTCEFDPGGIKCLTIPYATFKINEFTFKVQHTTIFEVIELLKVSATERIPGYLRVPMWFEFVIFPKELYDSLIAELERLLISDDELHAGITKFSLFQRLESTGGFLDLKTPREP